MAARFSKISIVLTGMILSTTSSAQKYFPAHWSVVSHIPPGAGQTTQPGLAGCISGIRDHVLIIAGGSNFPDRMPWDGGKKQYRKDLFALELHTDHTVSWIASASDTLPENIAYSACTSTPLGVMSAGGENEQGIMAGTFMLSWDATAQKIKRSTWPDLPAAVTNAAAAFADGRVYVAGGETKTGVSGKFYCLETDHPEKGWQQLPDLPAPTSHAVMLAHSEHQKTYIYIIGGRSKGPLGISDLYDHVYAYDVQREQWQQKASLPYALSAGTGICDDHRGIFLFGGDRGEVFHQVESLLAEIARETDPAKKAELTARKNALQQQHPGFSHEALRYSFRKNKWIKGPSLPFTIPVTTQASAEGDLICIPGGEIRAGVRTAQVITGKLER